MPVFIVTFLSAVLVIGALFGLRGVGTGFSNMLGLSVLHAALILIALALILLLIGVLLFVSQMRRNNKKREKLNEKTKDELQ